MATNTTSDPDAPPHYATIPAASRVLGIGERVLRRAIRDGQVPVYDVGGAWPRVALAEVQDWIRSTRIPATSHARARCDEVLARRGAR